MPKTKEFVSSDSEASDASSEVGQQHESNIIRVTHVIRISMIFLQFVGILHCVQLHKRIIFTSHYRNTIIASKICQ